MSSAAVYSVDVLKERVTPLNGYIRARLRLHNGDFVEAAEYFEQGPVGLKTIDYRYHWADAQQRLRRRWDNAPHHPELPGFPHHIHDSSEDNVQDGQPLSLLDMLAYIEAILTET
jgi:hypothetical protein